METAPQSDPIGRFPASFAQTRFWFQEQTRPGDKELNIAVRWEIRGRFSDAHLQDAIQLVVDRHEILRTRFIVTEGELFQEVVAHVGFRLGLVDLRAVKPAEHDARVAAMARELAARPFDLTQPCALRMTLVRLSADRAAILIAAHHIVFDGFSIGVLGDEIGRIMQGFAERRQPDLPEIDLHYGDYALWERELEVSGALEEDGAFWDSQLRGAPYFELDPDLPRPAQRSTSGATLVHPFPPDFDSRMAAFNRQEGISFFTLGAAALSAALHRWTGKTDILFATPVAGRTDVALEKLIGVFINSLVLRIGADPEATLRDHVARVSAHVKDALLHQDYPFEKLVQRLRPPRDPSRVPLVSVNLNMQRAFLKEQQYGGLELISVPSHMPGVVYDLNIQIIGRKSGWKLMIDYNTSLFRPATVAQFADLLVQAFDTILTRPDSKLGALPAPKRTDAVPAAAETAPESPAPEPQGQDGAATRAAVQRIWAEILGRPAADCTGDFFDLGGHSLAALRMLAQVQTRFGQQLPLAAFLADPTLEALVANIATALPSTPDDTSMQHGASAFWETMPLRPGPDGGPLLVTINQPFLYHALARSLALDIEVVNLSIPDIDRLEGLGADAFDTLAQDAASVLKARHSGRQLLFLGHCVDGALALRIAQSEFLATEDIVLVAMIDTWEPGAILRRSARERMRLRWLMRLRRWGHYLGERHKGRIGWTDLFLETRPGPALLRRLGVTAPQEDAVQRAIAVNHRLVQFSRDIAQAPYDGAVILFKTLASADTARAQAFGWADLLPADAAVHDLPGWHQDALRTTGTDRIARILEARIARSCGQLARPRA